MQKSYSSPGCTADGANYEKAIREKELSRLDRDGLLHIINSRRRSHPADPENVPDSAHEGDGDLINRLP